MELQQLYCKHPSLYDDTRYWDGFEWVVVNDNEHSVFAYKRKSQDETLLVILNFAYCEWPNYQFDIEDGDYKVLMCSEDEEYSGSKHLKNMTYHSNGKLVIDLPYNSGIILRKEKKNV